MTARTVSFEEIRVDARFNAAMDRAHMKARRALDRLSTKADTMEEVELERHRKRMAEIREARQRARGTYHMIMDEAEHRAFKEAEERLSRR